MTSANSNRFCEERVTFDHSECWGRDDRITLFVYFYRNLGCPPKSSWYEIDGAIERPRRHTFLDSVHQNKKGLKQNKFPDKGQFDTLMDRLSPSILVQNPCGFFLDTAFERSYVKEKFVFKKISTKRCEAVHQPLLPDFAQTDSTNIHTFTDVPHH